MKKFLYSFAFFIITLVLPCIYAKASYLPPVSPVTTQIPSFLQTVAQTQIANDTGYYSSYKPDYDTLNQIVNGRTIEGSMTEVYVDNSTFSDMDDFVNSQGQYVSPSDTFTAFGSSDVGRYSYVADKNTGEILSYEVSGSLQSTLQAGGQSAMPYPIWLIDQLDHLGAPTLQNYQNLLSLVEDAQMHDRLDIYDESQLTQSQIDFINDNDFYMYIHSNNKGFDMYVPNGCSVNCVIPGNGESYHGVVGNGSTQNSIVFCTAPNQVHFDNGNSENLGFMYPQSVTYFGRNWNYVPAWYNSFNILDSGGFVSYKSPTEEQFNEALSISSDYVTMQPVYVTNEGDTYYYDYTSVTNNPPQYNTTINNSYNYELPVSPQNYPVTNTITLNYPSNDTNNYINNIYNYYTQPGIGEDIGQTDPDDITDGIPILNNLRYRFPFSIPFDIHDLISGLVVTREAPNFHWEVFIPVIDYTWEIDFDLSAWDSQARIFRTCFLILFIIALGMWAYSHFFGS